MELSIDADASSCNKYDHPQFNNSRFRTHLSTVVSSLEQKYNLSEDECTAASTGSTTDINVHSCWDSQVASV